MQASQQKQHNDQEPSQREVAATIAENLHVTDEEGQAQIFQMVRNLGRTQARQFAEEALQDPEQQSSSVQDPNRLSPKEVFLHLVQTKGKPKERRRARTGEVATTIAERLHETEKIPKAQIQRIVHIIGEEQALAYLDETLHVEEAGGMLRADGSSRRTPGGVYFFLVKGTLPVKTRYKVFPQHSKQGARGAQAPQPLASHQVVLQSLT